MRQMHSDKTTFVFSCTVGFEPLIQKVLEYLCLPLAVIIVL